MTDRSRPKELINELQDLYSLASRGLLAVAGRPFYLRDTIEQMDYAGPGSLVIILLVSLFIGMALSLQLSAELSTVGLKIYTGKIIGTSIIRELGPGLPEAPPLQPGALIEGKTPMELSGMLEAGNQAIQKINPLVGKGDELVEKISRGEGTLYKLILDPSLYNSLMRSATALESTMENIERSRGTLKRLIDDPSLYDRTLSAVSGIERIMRDLETGQGSLGKMLTDPGLYENLNQAAKDLDAVLEEIENGKGLARALLRDEELVKQVRESLGTFRTAKEEMKSLLKKMEEHPKKYFKFSIF